MLPWRLQSFAFLKIIPHNMPGFHIICLFALTIRETWELSFPGYRNVPAAVQTAEKWSLMSWCTPLMYCAAISCNHLTCGAETLISSCTPNGITLGHVDQHQYTMQSYESLCSLVMLINSSELCHRALSLWDCLISQCSAVNKNHRLLIINARTVEH